MKYKLHLFIVAILIILGIVVSWLNSPIILTTIEDYDKLKINLSFNIVDTIQKSELSFKTHKQEMPPSGQWIRPDACILSTKNESCYWIEAPSINIGNYSFNNRGYRPLSQYSKSLFLRGNLVPCFYSDKFYDSGMLAFVENVNIGADYRLEKNEKDYQSLAISLSYLSLHPYKEQLKESELNTILNIENITLIKLYLVNGYMSGPEVCTGLEGSKTLIKEIKII